MGDKVRTWLVAGISVLSIGDETKPSGTWVAVPATEQENKREASNIIVLRQLSQPKSYNTYHRGVIKSWKEGKPTKQKHCSVYDTRVSMLNHRFRGKHGEVDFATSEVKRTINGHNKELGTIR